MLGDRHAAGRDDDGDGGRDVERMEAIAPGAAHVDGIFGSVDRDHPRAHRPRGGGDFDGCLAPVAELGEKVRGVGVAGASVEDGGKGDIGLRFIQRGRRVGQATHDVGLGRSPAIFMKLASISWPYSVAMLSGWNWTLWMGRFSC